MCSINNTTFLPSGLPRKGLVLAHLNICSLRNKVHEITRICSSDNIHVLALSETHLDDTYDDSELAVEGYSLFRRDRDKYGGGVAFYVQAGFQLCLETIL